jgi:hypothetical protein
MKLFGLVYWTKDDQAISFVDAAENAIRETYVVDEGIRLPG